MTRDEILKTLRSALAAAVREGSRDPHFLQRVVGAVCDELRVDPMIGAYLLTRVASLLKKEG
mgnify:CR=1 FL=1